MVPHANTPAAVIRCPPQNLPAAPTPLVGREAELATLRRLLLRPDVRLVTLTGAPGTGKTRLAVALAATLSEDVPDGVVFVPLETVREPAEVIPTIARTLGLRETVGQSAREALREALLVQERLLVLDNFEQVLPAAEEVGTLLAACPGLTVLITSRAALRVRWEYEHPVNPLALPPLAVPISEVRPPGSMVPDAERIREPDRLLQYAAVRLFVERAQAMLPSFRLTVENADAVVAICRRLDGLPLAIELAAARIKLFPPRALLERLERALDFLSHGPRDLPARHQMLRGAIAWSYELLSPAEQALFRRLGVFRDDCTLEAVEAVGAGTEEPSGDLLESVTALIDHHLVISTEGPDGEPWLRMLETVREYALELLEASGEAPEVRRRHAAYHLDLADRNYRLRQEGVPAWLGRRRRDLRAALDWSLATADAETALRLASSLALYWWELGQFAEGRQWLERALALGEAASPSARARALLAVGALRFLQGDQQPAAEALTAGRALYQQIGEAPDMAGAIALLANLQPDFEQRRALAEESLALCRQTGDRWGIGLALGELGLLARDQRDYARAAALLAESVARFREANELLGVCRQLLILGAVIQRQGVHDQAAACFVEGLVMATQLGDQEGIARGLGRASGLAAERGEAEQAARLFGAAQARFDAAGVRLWSRRSVLLERHLVAIRARLGDEAFATAQTLGRAMAVDEALTYAREYLATVRAHAADVAEDTSPARARLRADGLTERQLEVLRLIAAGKTTKEIAAALVVSEHTVERHITHIYQKTGARSRAEATAYALRHGFAQP